MHSRRMPWISSACLAAALVAASAWAAAGETLQVFQDLEEVTGRIPNLKDKPYKAIIDACDGFFQCETIIFRDLETGSEVWSLSREECMDCAHTGRRPAWSADGRYISFTGNMVFWNLENNQLWKRGWAGYTYVANADGSRKRPLWAIAGGAGGKLSKFNSNKYNMWDARVGNWWYCVQKDELWRVTVEPGLKDSKAEAICKFPNAAPKIIQEISDGDCMLIEEEGDKPNCYVVNLNKKPDEPGFCMSYPLAGAIHSGSFRIRRGQNVVHGGYEPGRGGTGGIMLQFDEQGLRPSTLPEVHLTEGVEMAHLWYGPPDDRVAFSGSVQGKGSGLFVQLPGKPPVMLAKVSDGHPTWCGRDPEWFFYAVGTPDTDSPYSRHLVAGRADGSELRKICTPFDRRRGGGEPYSAIPLPIQSRDATKCWFHSSMLMPNNNLTGSYIAVFRRPYPPTEVTAAAGTVKWKAHALSSEVKGYHVYRSDDGGKSFAEVTGEAVAGTEFKDASPQRGGASVYAVTAEEWSGLESDTATTSARGSLKGWDKAPPAKVAGLKAERKDSLVWLTWTRSAEKDLRHYNIYASSAERPKAEQKRLLVSPPRGEVRYIDWTAPQGAAMYYAVTARDRQGNESEPVYAECK